MYEARQYKDKVSRGIDINIQRQVNARRYNTEINTLQRVRTYTIEQLSLFGHPKTTFLTTNAIDVNRRKTYTKVGLGDDQYNFDKDGIIKASLLGVSIPRSVQDISMATGELEKNELLILVSHGSRPTKKNPNSVFGNMTPSKLAQKIHGLNILPEAYNGQIYLDGCHTGEPLNNLNDGTSFAERFKTELSILVGHKNFSVKGNLGEAITGDTQLYPIGTEWIKADDRSSSLIVQNAHNLINAGINIFNNREHIHFIDVNKPKYSIGPLKIGRKNVTYIRGRFTKMIY